MRPHNSPYIPLSAPQETLPKNGAGRFGMMPGLLRLRRPVLLPVLAAVVLALLAAAALSFFPAPTDAQTPAWNGIVPPGLDAGAQYRILFVTNGKRNAEATGMNTYNTFVRNQKSAATGDPFADITFNVLGSTQAVDARCNTQTHTADAQCPGRARVDDVPIYYYKGEKVADDYGDLYDGSWGSQEPRDQNGDVIGGANPNVFTGSSANGTAHIALFFGNASAVRQGRPKTAGNELDVNNSVPSSQRAFYALSEVLTVPPDLTDYDQDDDGLIEVFTLRQLNAMRRDLDGDGTASAGNELGYAAAFPDAAEGMGCGWDDPDTTETTTACRGYELMADLDFDTDGDGATHTGGVGDAGDAYYNAGNGWEPIGGDSDPFATTFEGNGRTIVNLFISRSAADFQGLFGVAGGSATLRNARLVNASVAGKRYVGGLVGDLLGTVTASSVTGNFSGGDLVGGLAGRVNTTGAVLSSYVTGSLTASASSNTLAGGLVGHMVLEATVDQSYANVTVSAPDAAGGLVGTNEGAITDSYATGSVTGVSKIGGLVGWNSGAVAHSYATGSVSGAGSDVGGLIGAVAGTPDVTASYWDTDTTGIAADADTDSPEGRTTTQLQAPTSAGGIYAAWDATVWDFGDAGRYPALKADFDGDGTATVAEFGGQGRDRPARVRGVSAQSPAADAITLTWDAPDDGGSAITGYTVERSEDGGATWAAQSHSGATTSIAQSGLTDGTTYSYRVKATSANGDSAVWSETASATPVATWNGIVPSGLQPGGKYRILFATSADYQAGSSAIGVYDGRVQNAIGAGHALAGVTFKALGSAGSVDARCNTQTHEDPSDCSGAPIVDDVPIYYYLGDRVADNYGDFYDGQWASQQPRDEDGELISGNPPVFTGSSSSGVGISGRKLGGSSNNLRIGRPATSGEELDSGENRLQTSAAALYGLSEVLTAPGSNQAPQITSGPTSRTMAENSVLTVVGTYTAMDPENAAVTWSLAGDDADDFIIINGVLTFRARPDFENPTDADTDNIYEVTVRVSDGALEDTRDVTITVTDVAEPPSAPAMPTFGAATTTSLTVNWAAPANTGPAITDYGVQYRAGSSGAFTDAGYDGVGAVHTITGLTAETSYQVRVRATNAEGTGPWSASATGATPAEIDYDRNDDSLIDVFTLAQLNAMRWDLDGDGTASAGNEASYAAAFPNAGLGCGATACRGYELAANLDFDTDGDGATHTKGVGDAGDDYHNGGSGWEPIGTSSNAFAATFDGNGRAIANLFINRGSADSVGLFGRLDPGAEIRSVGVVDVSVAGNDYVGGLVGWNLGSVTASYVTGSVGGNDFVGGLVGAVRGTIAESYATSSVGGNDYVGGLVGYTAGAEISDSYAMGDVSGDDYVGGLVGFHSGAIANSYATGWVTGDEGVGGLMGGQFFGRWRVYHSYWDRQTSGTTYGFHPSLQGKTTRQLQAPTTASGIYSAWDAAKWDFGDASSYPMLRATRPAPATNQAPQITGGPTSLSYPENGVAAVGTYTATDPENAAITWSLAGADAGDFGIVNGVLAFGASPDFESPTDADTDNVYEVTVRVSDGGGLTASIDVTITVTDVDEPPAAPAAPTLGAATSTSLAVNWAAPANTGPAITDYDVQYREGSSGAFIDAGYDGVGTVHTITGLTAETSYQVQVRATNAEGIGPWSASGTITTTTPSPTNQAPTFPSATATRAVAENTAANQNIGLPVSATDPDTGDILAYSLHGTDATSFAIVSTSGQLQTKAALDHETEDEYEVRVTVTDGGGLTASIEVTISVTDVDEPPEAPDTPTLDAPTSTSLEVNWAEPANTGPAITDYNVQYREGDSGAFTDAGYDGVGTVHTITGLTAETSYQVQVQATNAEGTGPWSASGTITTPPAPVSIFWSPPGLSEGARFRVLFITGQRDATSSNIDTYNSFVQNDAAGAYVNAFAGVAFKVLGSTPAVDARCNTQTHTVAGHCPGVEMTESVPIYYYRGDRVADGYQDLYSRDGWDSQQPKNRDGVPVRGILEVHTGSIRLGIERKGHALGDAEVQVGRPDQEGREMRSRRSTSSREAERSLYALSEVLTVVSTR